VRRAQSPYCAVSSLSGQPIWREPRRRRNALRLLRPTCYVLVQLIAEQKGLSHPAIDAQGALVDRRIEANRKKAAAAA
jgi:hypothetical protein